MQPKIFPSEAAAVEAIESALSAVPQQMLRADAMRAMEFAYVLQRLGLIDWRPGVIEKASIDSSG